MRSGHFYFISDDYYEKFEGQNLMPNKDADDDGLHGRPCYYSFRDNDSGVLWMVPISSQLEKYEPIYNERVQKYRTYDGIKFGFVLGEKKAFLIQNLCPTIDKYITNVYIDRTTQQPVVISDSLKSELNASVRKAVRLYRRGIKIVFADILHIEKELLKELELEETTEPANTNDKAINDSLEEIRGG